MADGQLAAAHAGRAGRPTTLKEDLPVLANHGGVAFDLSAGNSAAPNEPPIEAALYLQENGHVDADEDNNAQEASRAAFVSFDNAATVQPHYAAPDGSYKAAETLQLLDMRTRQLKQLQQDYLRLHEHTLQAAQWYAEQQAEQQAAIAKADAARDSMREQLNQAKGRAHAARPGIGAALQSCEKMLSRLAAIRSVDQLPNELSFWCFRQLWLWSCHWPSISWL